MRTTGSAFVMPQRDRREEAHADYLEASQCWDRNSVVAHVANGLVFFHERGERVAAIYLPPSDRAARHDLEGGNSIA